MSAAEVAEHQRTRIQGAMLQIVAGRGYPAVTVRELAQVSGVSSRAFYEHYSGKQDCFLRTHESIARGVARRVAAAQAGEPDWRKRLRLTIEAYLGELQRDLRVARLLLVDAYVAGSVALKQVRWAEQALEVRIADCFEPAKADSPLPPQITRGLAAGVICSARFQLVNNKEPAFGRLVGELTRWVSAVFNISRVEAVPEPDFRRPTLVDSSESPTDLRPCWAAFGERDLIVSALAKLAVVEGYEGLTVRKIRTSAGASSKKFNTHFSGVADCFQNAVEVCAESIAVDQGPDPRSQDSGNRRAVDSIAFLCERVAEDPALAALGFVDVFGPGPESARSLELFLEQIGELLARQEGRRADMDPSVYGIAAAAIWGAIREEVVSGRRRQLPAVAPLLRKLALLLSGEQGAVPAPPDDAARAVGA
jgi:TetR/AcrR family transcriptional regulator